MSQAAPDARALLQGLVGKTIHTIAQRKPNRVVRLTGDQVIVATEKAVSGEAVPIDWVQRALDMLYENGEVKIDVKTVGYRSAFIGAVLATLPDTLVATNPRRIRLERKARE